jgi:hypothetical protein
MQSPEAKLTDHAIFQMQIVGSNTKAKIVAQDKVAKKSNYITGKDKSKWATKVGNYASVRYQEILKNIDVVYYGNNGRLEYDFIVKPQANVADIKLNFNGVDKVTINKKGQLVLTMGKQEIIQKAPISYQLDNQGNRLPVKSKYTLVKGTVAFDLGQYDKEKELVIDPVLEYSRYYGGLLGEFVYDLDVDSSDNIYMMGTTSSPDLATAGAYQEINNSPLRNEFISFILCDDCTDGPGQVERVTISEAFFSSVFVTKFSNDGSTILWSTYFSHDTVGVRLGINSAAVSPSGEVAFGIVQGAPDGLPLVNSTQAFSATQNNSFVAKLNADGDDLIFSTYLHMGPNGFFLRGLDVAADGSVAATGLAADFSFTGGIANIDFPEINPIPGQSCALDTSTFQDLTDGWVIRFDTTGTATFASCLGGSIKNGVFSEGLRGVAIGSNGHLYVVGYSAMTDFPTINPVQGTQSFSGYRDTTITEIDPANSQIVFSTYLGPTRLGIVADGTGGEISDSNFPIDIDVDSSGNIYVVGQTNQSGWPTKNAFQSNFNTIEDASLTNQAWGAFQGYDKDLYLTKINPNTQSIVFSTYLGGSNGEGGLPTLSLDSSDNSYIYFLTDSADFPMANPVQSVFPGVFVPAISKFSPDGALVFSSYIGTGDKAVQQNPGGLTINSAGKIILAGYTNKDDFPIVGSGTTRIGAFDATLTIIAQPAETDTDGDGVIDSLDAFPSDATEWIDTDSDLVGNNTDTDDDGDTVLDVDDVFPLLSSESSDADGDGFGDNADVFPSDPENAFDIDGNGLGDFTEIDADKDGVANDVDFRPFDASEWFDIDGDGIGNNTDLDDDGDGVADTVDVAPTNADDPVITFNRFDASKVDLYKSPLPSGFSALVSSDKSWTSATDQSFSGRTSMGTREIGDSESAGLQYDEVFEAGNLSFHYKVDSESTFDFFTFSIDGTVMLTASGQVDWTQFTTPITAGAHTLVWKYTKDTVLSVGSDAVWIDDLTGSPPGAVDLVTTVVNEDGIIVSGGTAHYTITVLNNSSAPTALANLLLNMPPEISNIFWNCVAPVSFTGTSCNSAYGTTRRNIELGVNGSGIGDIDAVFDIGPRESIVFNVVADVTVIADDNPITVPASVSVAAEIREDNTQDNMATETSFSGIFANGFE